MVQPSDPWVRDYGGRSFSAQFRGTAERGILAEPETRSVLVIGLDKCEKKATRMPVVRHDGVVEWMIISPIPANTSIVYTAGP